MSVDNTNFSNENIDSIDNFYTYLDTTLHQTTPTGSSTDISAVFSALENLFKNTTYGYNSATYKVSDPADTYNGIHGESYVTNTNQISTIINKMRDERNLDSKGIVAQYVDVNLRVVPAITFADLYEFVDKGFHSDPLKNLDYFVTRLNQVVQYWNGTNSSFTLEDSKTVFASIDNLVDYLVRGGLLQINGEYPTGTIPTNYGLNDERVFSTYMSMFLTQYGGGTDGMTIDNFFSDLWNFSTTPQSSSHAESDVYLRNDAASGSSEFFIGTTVVPPQTLTKFANMTIPAYTDAITGFYISAAPATEETFVAYMKNMIYGVFVQTTRQTVSATEYNDKWVDLGLTNPEIKQNFDRAFGQFLEYYMQFKDWSNLTIGKATVAGNTVVTFGDDFMKQFANFATGTAYIQARSTGSFFPDGYVKQNDKNNVYPQMINVYKAFYPNNTLNQFHTRLNQFMDKYITSDDPAAYFLPSQMIDDFFMEIRDEYFLGVTGIDPSGRYDDVNFDAVRVLMELFTLLLDTSQDLQKLTVAISNRLEFFAKYQKSYTDLMAQIPVFGNEPGTAWSTTSTNSTKLQEAQEVRQNLATLNASYTENLRAFRDIEANRAKQVQTQVTQGNEGVSQMTNMVSSLLQQWSSLLSAIFRQ